MSGAESMEPELKQRLPSNVLDDLCCRFIINVPSQEKNDLVRVCFQIEQAHWFFMDFYGNKYKRLGFKEFAKNIFFHIPYLRPFAKDLNTVIEDWKEYKYAVPTFGAIILDEDLEHVLLVKSYWSRASWGFPKGKVNKDETPWHCAAREVYEETGFNIGSLIDPSVFLEAIVNDQCVRLYIVTGVSRQTEFRPLTRNEIKEIDWFPVEGIPLGKRPKNKVDSFFMVMPFVRNLRKWILQNRRGKATQRRSFKSFSEVEHLLNLDPIRAEEPGRPAEPRRVEEERHYEGSDEEEEVLKSNEEIYGIPKVRGFRLSAGPSPLVEVRRPAQLCQENLKSKLLAEYSQNPSLAIWRNFRFDYKDLLRCLSD